MGDKTGISWTDASWNCIRGCSRVSEGCRHCYAETMAGRFCGPGRPYDGLATRKEREVKIAATLTKRPDGTIDQKSQFKTISEARWTGKVSFIPEHLLDPVRWQKARRIFVNSMSDIFHEGLSNEQIAAIFAVMALAKRHTFQVLTKRSRRMREWFQWAGRLTMPEILGFAYDQLKDHPDELATLKRADRNLGGYMWPLPNVWIGVSVENQEAADERIPDLLGTPAVVRFLSCEPLIDSVSLAKWLREGGKSGKSKDNPDHTSASSSVGGGHVQSGESPETGNVAESQVGPGGSPAPATHPLLSWVIAGCESGPGMRDCNHQWLRVLRDECRRGGIRYFLKQARSAQEGGHRLYPSGQAARSEVVDVVKAGEGSKVKPGGVIERPYLDGFTHQEFPA